MSVVLDKSLESSEAILCEVPIIDIRRLVDGSDELAVAKEVGQACKNIGFLYIKNHGVSSQLIQDAYRVSKQFFDLEKEEKNKLDIKFSGPTLRGYIAPYAENVNPGVTNDLKECFDFGTETEEVSPFFGKNLYPENFPEFKEIMDDYHFEMLMLAKKLVRAIALSLELPADYFEEKQRNPISIQRLLHYPPQYGEISEKEIGAGAHTDYGFLTILSQDDNGGLQVKSREDTWVSAPPLKGTFIVNIGDLIQTLTNDHYLSTVHRVVNTSGNERYSMPFFFDMDFDALVEVVPTCTDDENPPKYSPYICGNHKYQRFVDSFEHLS